MSISKEQLQAIIGGKARQMCSPENDRKYNELAGRFSINENGNPDPSEYDCDADEFDSMYLSENAKKSANDYIYTENSAKNSKLPEAIKSSMINERIDVSNLGVGASVLDEMNIPKPKKNINENRQPVSQQQSGLVIDYSIIKAIVNECLNEYSKSNVINEGVINGIKLKNGTITIVDSKGNVYKAKLEKVKK